MMRIHILMAAVILASAFASGCGYHPVYDESWAEQVKVESDACPVIDGDYQNAGETFLKPPIGRIERENVSLAHLLNGWNDAGGHQADNRLGQTFYDPAEDAYQTVSLRLADGKLHIEAALADGSSRAFDLPTRRQCRDSTLLLEAFWDSFEIGYIRETVALGRAEDGSLLAYKAWTTVFIAPLVGHDAVWIRFPPAAPAQRSVLTP